MLSVQEIMRLNRITKEFTWLQSTQRRMFVDLEDFIEGVLFAREAEKPTPREKEVPPKTFEMNTPVTLLGSDAGWMTIGEPYVGRGRWRIELGRLDGRGHPESVMALLDSVDEIKATVGKSESIVAVISKKQALELFNDEAKTTVIVSPINSPVINWSTQKENFSPQ